MQKKKFGRSKDKTKKFKDKPKPRIDIMKEMDLKDSKDSKSKPMRQAIAKKEETSEEKFMKVQISEVENSNLNRVFKLFSGKRFPEPKDQKEKEKHKNTLKWFDASDVKRILKELGVKEIREHEINIMIWEVDENLDKRVDEHEFELMYKKCIEDKTGLEARNLFNLVQFLMFCKPPENENGEVEDEMIFNKKVKAEDTYSLIYGRLDRQNPEREIPLLELLDQEIELIFQDKDDPEIEIDYLQYLKRVNQNALDKRLENKAKDQRFK